MKRIKFISKKLKESNYSTKVYFYMSTRTMGDDYDPHEKNYQYSNLNPLVIKAFVRQITPDALVYKQYGLAEMGAVEVICNSKYKNYFTKANKIIIDSDEYAVFKEGEGNRALITKRTGNILRVILSKRS